MRSVVRKVVRVRQLGGVEALELEEEVLRDIGRLEILVEILVAGVNFSDIYRRRGEYLAELPFIPGLEIVGTVRSMGSDVRGLEIGDVVAALLDSGGYATHALVSIDRLLPIPDGLSAIDACALIVQGMTADYLAGDAVPLSAGMTVVVMAAAGGVGRLLVQMARDRGVKVIAVTSTPKVASVLEAGAHVVIDRESGPIAERVLHETDGHGADVIFDSIGAPTYREGMAAVRRRGVLVWYGQAGGAIPPMDTIELAHLGSLTLIRPRLRDYIAEPSDLQARAKRVFRLAAEGRLKVVIDSTYPLAAVAAAQQHVESGSSRGKVLLRMADPLQLSQFARSSRRMGWL